MSIASNSIITWTDFTSLCLSSLKSACCNIDSFASDVPDRLKSGQTQVAVKTLTTSVSAGGTAQTYTWYANPSNLMSTVTTATVESEWTTFLSDAGITARSSKIIQAKELTLAVALYMQFLSYHVKPIYSRRQIYNTLETQTLYQGSKYIAGTIAPKYTLTAIEQGSIPAVDDSDITNIVSEGFTVSQLITKYNNPLNHRCYLS